MRRLPEPVLAAPPAPFGWLDATGAWIEADVTLELMRRYLRVRAAIGETARGIDPCAHAVAIVNDLLAKAYARSRWQADHEARTHADRAAA